MTISARYENGVFKPLQDVPIEEGTVVEVCLPVELPAKRPRSIGDSPFADLWKDREDMADSVEYINRLRRDLHGGFRLEQGRDLSSSRLESALPGATGRSADAS